jgi:alkylated DNA repair dioxygenase AlkB
MTTVGIDTSRQLSIFGGRNEAWESFDLCDADVRLSHNFLGGTDADRVLNALLTTIPWKQDKIRCYGKVHDVPRLHQWYGDPGLTYTWSGITMHPEPWIAILQEVREHAERVSGTRFNTVLLNYYRNGEDSLSWHADDEPELGKTPIIASVSLGAERDFLMRHNDWPRHQDQKIRLSHGSLLVMGGTTQSYWKHSVPRRKRVHQPRVNLTFRQVGSRHQTPVLRRNEVGSAQMNTTVQVAGVMAEPARSQPGPLTFKEIA